MPAAAETRILFVGDMHLGRLPSSIPASLLIADLGPRRAWERVVQAALDHEVHCVALAGDLVEGDNAFFEAFGLLATGVRDLAAAGIEVCAVAGNHDTATLPRLAAQISNFHLLGAGGTWSTFTVDPTGAPGVRLAGWSFPDRHHRTSPLDAQFPPAEPGLVNFGLLHADLDAGTSSYAPVTSSELRATSYQGWFLGHVHLPGAVPEDGTPFYLGSVTPLTPGEQGLHGPLLVKVAGDGGITRRRLPLAPLRWEELPVNCSQVADPAQNLQSHLLTAINQQMSRLDGELDQVFGLGLRLVLTGQVNQPAAFAGTLAGIPLETLTIPRGRLTAFVQKITSQVTGTFDLPGLAQLDNPAGLLARQILLLEGETGPAGARQELLLAARKEVAAVDQRDVFASLQLAQDEAPLSDTDLTEILADVARGALADLLAGREGGHAAL